MASTLRAALMGAVISAAAAGASQATTLASSDFSTGTDGWTIGTLTKVAATSATPSWDPAGYLIAVDPPSGPNALIAPSQFVAAAAVGDTFSFQLGDSATDGIAYSPFSLISTSGAKLFAKASVVPTTDANSFTDYAVQLVASNFFTGNPDAPDAGTSVSDAQFAAVLGSLAQIGIDMDWKYGDETVRLDNVVLSNSDQTPAAPEPSTWLLMMAGVAAAGFALRMQSVRNSFA